MPLMMCGHAANAHDENGDPSCAICIGLDAGAKIVVNEAPNLEGRLSQCAYCRSKTQSSLTLPFFEYRPDKEFDAHYDGCYGWE